MSRVAVIGTGYVGLTTGACLAHLGHAVVCADIDQAKIELLQSGRIPIYEQGLEALVADGLATRRLQFVVGAAQAVEDARAEFVFLCVQTPQGPDGSADLRYVEQASAEIGPALATGAVVITKSTVPVGSARVVERALARTDVAVVSNPEFLREGQAVHDCLHPDRIVIGSDDQAAAAKVAALYQGLNAPAMVTDPATAETIKYACNAFLATKVSFINAIANLCQAVGADVRDVVLGMGYDKRIGFEFLKPGPGWGGSCFPKDSRALVRIAEDAGYDFELLKGVIAVNDLQFRLLADRIAELAGGAHTNPVVAVWGLTFKAGTDDLRDSPAISVVERLLAGGATIKAYDPTVNGTLPAHFDHLDIEVCDDPYAACAGAAVLTVLTEWDEFRWLDFEKVAGVMAAPAILDARNLLDPISLRRRGFVYEGLGRK
ncbi:MAG: UDPglucose 6-dehydrogenase [Acidimicrobiaceae bacterium]|jgi:UDPglucose 6-dehydrogenase|nr:UDPglucose 6-dehydrogenase [Acidimicrobiaceae bacterium]MDQ1377881.1 UDPglucose 6-dehydrogenase [Acidimicrobiaceae bacterium]MDQ1416547.1 UDPglucose 6-dehydrogenase [Acidimicrobiaceae bacterium]MDQ1419246.1 UDPglucose 6-dehydrogenase [Acidimicrobiaceae bacterium]